MSGIHSNAKNLEKFIEKLSDKNFDVTDFLKKLRLVDDFSFETLFQKSDISNNLEECNNSDDLGNL